MSKWISVKDRLPHAEYGESSNVLCACGDIKILYFDGGNWCYPTGEPYIPLFPECRVTHWMELPMMPKEEVWQSKKKPLQTC